MNHLTHYQTLGLSQDATAQDIKKRYRELARRYHPDVAQAQDSVEKFKEINEAHRILGDPERRANYDAELALARMRQDKAQRTERDQRGNPASNASAPKRPSPNTGGGAQRPNANQRSSEARPSPEVPDRPAVLIANARKALGRLRYREAEALCREALRFNRRNVEAYEILGDIARARNRTEDAISYYSYAIQLDPNNRSVRVKFDKVTGQPTGPTMAGNAARSSSTRSFEQIRYKSQRSVYRRFSTTYALVTAVGLAIIATLVYNVTNTGGSITGPWIIDWAGSVVFSLVAAGAVGGLLCSVNGLMGSARRELLGGHHRRGNFVVPIGAIVLAFSVIQFYGAMAICYLLQVATNNSTGSQSRLFALTFLLTMLFALALANGVGSMWVMLSGGNLIYVGAVIGWAIGDTMKQ